MKDAKGHGSDNRGTYNAATAAVVPAHQRGVAQATARTPEEHIQAGGKLPTEAQHAELERRNSDMIRVWKSFGRGDDPAVARLQDELDRSRANQAKFGLEEKPTAYTLKLRGQMK